MLHLIQHSLLEFEEPTQSSQQTFQLHTDPICGQSKSALSKTPAYPGIYTTVFIHSSASD